MKTLSELRQLKEEYLQQAIDNEIPQKLIKIASLGELYHSNHHGDYRIHAVLVGKYYAVVSHKQARGQLIKHGQWEQLDRILVSLQSRYDPTKLDYYENLPDFASGLIVCRWELSDQWNELSKSSPLNLYVPGEWINKVLNLLPEAETLQQKNTMTAQEQERQILIQELLIGEEV